MTLDGRVAAGESEIGHLDDETLAAYADGKLTDEERTHTERHLSICPTCRDIVTDAVALEVEEGRSQPQPVRRWRPRPLLTIGGAGLAAAAALLLVVQVQPEWLGGAPRRPELIELIAAYEHAPTRPAEGRLTGFAYGPAPAVTRGDARIDAPPDVRIAIARIEARAQQDNSLAALWQQGIAQLAMGEAATAVTALESAATLDPDNAELQSDLAAAYVARGRNTRSDEDMNTALARADRALRLKPGLPEALFNRALALDALRRSEAPSAWQEVAQAEGGSPWAKEAAARRSFTPAR
jgi:cellulose synthase operon protein C